MKITNNQSTTGLVQKYIGSAYDKVALVATEIDNIGTLATAIEANADFALMAEVINTLGDSVSDLAALASADLAAISVDLVKGNYLGNRKIDIDLALNNESELIEVSYQGATITTNTGAVLQIDFTATDSNGNNVIEELSSYTAIYNAIVDGIDVYNAAEPDVQQHIVNTEIDIINSTLPSLPTMIRFRDLDGSASSIDRIELKVFSGNAVNTEPNYFWAKTTSALQTLANRVGDVIALGNDIDSIIALASQTDEIGYIYEDRDKLTGPTDSLFSELSKLQTLHTNLLSITDLAAVITQITDLHADQDKLTGNTDSLFSELSKLQTVFASLSSVVSVDADIANVNIAATNIADINFVANNIIAIQNAQANANIATAKALEAANSAAQAVISVDTSVDQVNLAINQVGLATNQVTLATAQAVIAADKAASITGATVGSTITASAGSNALVTFNSNDSTFSFVIPEGDKGEKGDAFQVNAVGLAANKSVYDDRVEGFSYLATDTAEIYFKVSNGLGDWSAGAPFGKGDDGDIGNTGNGIVNTIFTSTTDGSGLAGASGATDTYTITYTDSSTSTFDVKNGLDGSVAMVKETFTATASQTVFAIAGGYTPGLLDVYRNGLKLLPVSDYTATDSANVTLNVGAALGDAIDFTGFGAFQVGDAHTVAQSNNLLSFKADITSLSTKADIASPTFTGTVSGVTQTMVGLSEVDNTTDVNKPISTSTQTALNLKANTTSISNIDNTSDVNKPVSITTQNALDLKADSTSVSTKADRTPVVHDNGTVTGSTLSIDFTNGTKQKATIGAALTISITGWPTSGLMGELELEIVNGGAFAVTLPTTYWIIAGGLTSTTFADTGITLNAAGSNTLIFWSDDAGAAVSGVVG